MEHPTRIFKTSDELKDAWDAYKKHRKESAKEWPMVQYVGKDGERKEDYPILPITTDGFYIYCREKMPDGTKRYGEVEQYFTNQDRLYDDFIGICRACKQERTDNQIIGGMLGIFNASITQRLNGLVEKQHNTIQMNDIFTAIDLDVQEDNGTS